MLKIVTKIARLLLKLYYEKAIRLRYPRLASVGPQSYIESPVTIIHPQKVSIGAHAVIRKFVWIYAFQTAKEAGISIGDHCEINPFCTIMGKDNVSIGNYVLISPNVTITSSTNDYRGGEIIAHNPLRMAPVRIEDNVHIGTGATILPGVTIGKGAVIGAGAVVTHDVPPYAIAVGIPARVIKYREGHESPR